MKNSMAKKYLSWYRKLISYTAADMQLNEQLMLAESILAEDKDKLITQYHRIPESLIDILEEIDGTCWRKYTKATVSIPFFATDSSAHFLNSAKQMLEHKNDGNKLNISNFVNNGEKESLYIDFEPSQGETAGQILKYNHDSKEFITVAASFDEFLEKSMNQWSLKLNCSIFECYDLENTKVMIEGKFNHHINAIKKAVQMLGGIIENALTPECDQLVIGEHEDKKLLKKAEQFDTQIYNEEDYIDEYLFAFALDKLVE